MSEKIVVPVLGESITEATVAKWLKNEGDHVEADEPIVELETDKVNLEVPSPIDGTLKEISSKDGSTVEVGALLGVINENGSNKLEKSFKESLEKHKNENNVVNLDVPKKKEDIIKKEVLEEEVPLKLTKEVEIENTTQQQNNQNQILSPAVRKIVEEKNIDLAKIKGSGKGGRVLKGDLISLMGVNPTPSARKVKYGEEERVKMSRLRLTIAKRLKQACLSLFAMVNLNLLILTLSSSPYLTFLADGVGFTPIKLIRSPFKTRPPFPDPLIFAKSIFFSSTIFLTAGDKI